MVSKSAKFRPLIYIIIFAIISAGSFFCAKHLNLFDFSEKPSTLPEIEVEVSPEPEKIVQKFDLNSLLSEWFATLPEGTSVGVEIYDLDNDYILAEKNSSEPFSTESIYKLFVVYYGYEELTKSAIEISSVLPNGKTIGTCLDLSIRESNSPCAESLRSYLGTEEIESALTSRYGVENTSVSGLTSTPSDLAHMLDIIHSHETISDDYYAYLLDSMLTQPPVDNGWCTGPCDWRQGLPSGFSEFSVYNKVGWRWGTNSWAAYADAAIISYEDKNYAVVVMTKNLPSVEYLGDLGRRIESALLVNQSEYLVDPEATDTSNAAETVENTETPADSEDSES